MLQWGDWAVRRFRNYGRLGDLGNSWIVGFGILESGIGEMRIRGIGVLRYWVLGEWGIVVSEELRLGYGLRDWGLWNLLIC